MPKHPTKTAPLLKTLSESAQALRDLEDGLWRRISLLQERDAELHAAYDKLWNAHDLVEDIRIAAEYAARHAPACVHELLVNYLVESWPGRPSRRTYFDNAVHQLTAARQAALAHADRRSTSEADAAAIADMLSLLADVDPKIAAVRFPS